MYKLNYTSAACLKICYRSDFNGEIGTDEDTEREKQRTDYRVRDRDSETARGTESVERRTTNSDYWLV